MTANWNGGTPETGSMTRRNRNGAVWARRRVRDDGTVMLLGRRFQPAASVQTPPVPGEWLLLFTYDAAYEAEKAARGDAPTCGEWTAPADPDGYIRRYYWEPTPAEPEKEKV